MLLRGDWPTHQGNRCAALHSASQCATLITNFSASFPCPAGRFRGFSRPAGRTSLEAVQRRTALLGWRYLLRCVVLSCLYLYVRYLQYLIWLGQVQYDPLLLCTFMVVCTCPVGTLALGTRWAGQPWGPNDPLTLRSFQMNAQVVTTLASNLLAYAGVQQSSTNTTPVASSSVHDSTLTKHGISSYHSTNLNPGQWKCLPHWVLHPIFGHCIHAARPPAGAVNIFGHGRRINVLPCAQ